MISDKGRVKQTTHEAVTHLVALFPLLVEAITDIIPNMDMSSFDETTKVGFIYIYCIKNTSICV